MEMAVRRSFGTQPALRLVAANGLFSLSQARWELALEVAT